MHVVGLLLKEIKNEIVDDSWMEDRYQKPHVKLVLADPERAQTRSKLKPHLLCLRCAGVSTVKLIEFYHARALFILFAHRCRPSSCEFIVELANWS